MTETVFPHGTPAGFAQGCKVGACPASETGRTCAQAAVRYRGNYEYKKLVDGGSASLDELRAPERFRKPVQPVKRRLPAAPPKAERVVAPAPVEELVIQVSSNRAGASAVKVKKQRGGIKIGPAEHGSARMYRLGCHVSSPCPGGSDGRTCAQVMSDQQRDYRERQVLEAAQRGVAPVQIDDRVRRSLLAARAAVDEALALLQASS